MFSRCKRANRVVHSANEWNLSNEVTEEFMNQLELTELKALCRNLSRELLGSKRTVEEISKFYQWAQKDKEDTHKRYSEMTYIQEMETKQMRLALLKIHAPLEEERDKLQKERLLLEKTRNQITDCFEKLRSSTDALFRETDALKKELLSLQMCPADLISCLEEMGEILTDPVSLDHFDDPVTFRGHTYSRAVVNKIAGDDICTRRSFKCPNSRITYAIAPNAIMDRNIVISQLTELFTTRMHKFCNKA
jgi:hypothetical protein